MSLFIAFAAAPLLCRLKVLLFIDYLKTLFTMPREAEPSLSERNFILKALEEGLRSDGRKFEQYRSRELSFGDEYGVAEVKFGKTRY